MNKIKKVLKNKKGIMGLDYICVAGVVIALTTYAMTAFYAQGKVMTDDAVNNLVEAQNIVQ